MTVPNYYNKFRCIADKCTHSCCIGWEIDIDEETLCLYNSLEGELADRIRNSICGDTPHFVLKDNDRCPFLSDNGLCEIICEYGEEALSDICYIHPRFQNDYPSFTEMGLGLCCEEAARIILCEKEKFSIDIPSEITEGEKIFLERRQEIFDILQNRNKTMEERFEHLAKKFSLDFEFSPEALADTYLSLERLDDRWTDLLNNIKYREFDKSTFSKEEYQLCFEQISVYFVFRHYERILKGDDEKSIINFVLKSCYLIGAMCSYEGNITEIARMYSAETEYSDNNMEELLNMTK